MQAYAISYSNGNISVVRSESIDAVRKHGAILARQQSARVLDVCFASGEDIDCFVGMGGYVTQV